MEGKAAFNEKRGCHAVLGIAVLVRYSPFYPQTGPFALSQPLSHSRTWRLPSRDAAERDALCELVLTSSDSPGNSPDGFALGKPGFG